MPYNELINDYEFVRDYLREFYIYGYRTKEETVSKQSRKHTQENKGTSNRSYEDKKRQIRSWLLGYIEDKKYVDGYVPYISIDSREIVHNPLYRTFKTGRFLKNDILTYFCLMDCMTVEWLSVSEITSLLSGYNLNNVKWSEKKVREKLRHYEMQIGVMPSEGLLYDETLHNMSAESIYDRIIKEMRIFKKLDTFRGFGKGDIFRGSGPHFEEMGKGVSLDEFFKNALREGLDYHMAGGRGYLPAGLVEEIRALTMSVIPWDVELAQWFDVQFPTLEKYRTYARPSRRQGATPDIPRPSYTLRSQELESRTFGVVVDTSGSMSSKQLGMALGSIASYASAKEVHFVRIIFCDAGATDAGYLAPEEIAGRVKVTGRGGTVLQPGIDCLEKAKDFPVNGPILIITDGMIENNLKVKREHAFLLLKGDKLPFQPKGKVFYFKEEKC